MAACAGASAAGAGAGEARRPGPWRSATGVSRDARPPAARARSTRTRAPTSPQRDREDAPGRATAQPRRRRSRGERDAQERARARRRGASRRRASLDAARASARRRRGGRQRGGEPVHPGVERAGRRRPSAPRSGPASTAAALVGGNESTGVAPPVDSTLSGGTAPFTNAASVTAASRGTKPSRFAGVTPGPPASCRRRPEARPTPRAADARTRWDPSTGGGWRSAPGSCSALSGRAPCSSLPAVLHELAATDDGRRSAEEQVVAERVLRVARVQARHDEAVHHVPAAPRAR